MARFILALALATSLLLPVSADAHRSHIPSRSHTRHLRSQARHHPHASRTTAHRHVTRSNSAHSLASPEPVALAKSVAERYWGTVPCGGQVAVFANQPLFPGLDSSTDGWATFESSLGPNDLEAPAATYTDCAISLAHWQWPTRSAMRSDWNMFCLTVIHEMGHLLGHPHSLTPGSVMAPVFTDESSVPPICRSTRPVEGKSGSSSTAG